MGSLVASCTPACSPFTTWLRAARMARQRRVLMRDDPLAAWFLVDQLSLYRLVGSAEIMAAQMSHPAAIAAIPNVTLQILPAVAHPANASEFIVTGSAAYGEHVAGGYVFTECVAYYITAVFLKASVLGVVAAEVAATGPGRAERIINSITDEPARAWALSELAGALAATDLDRAEHITNSITDESAKASALGSIAKALAA